MDDIRRVAPLWYDYTVRVRNDTLVGGWVAVGEAVGGRLVWAAVGWGGSGSKLVLCRLDMVGSNASAVNVQPIGSLPHARNIRMHPHLHTSHARPTHAHIQHAPPRRPTRTLATPPPARGSASGSRKCTATPSAPPSPTCGTGGGRISCFTRGTRPTVSGWGRGCCVGGGCVAFAAGCGVFSHRFGVVSEHVSSSRRSDLLFFPPPPCFLFPPSHPPQHPLWTALPHRRLVGGTDAVGKPSRQTTHHQQHTTQHTTPLNTQHPSTHNTPQHTTPLNTQHPPTNNPPPPPRSFDKHWFFQFDVHKCPPWNLDVARPMEGLFPPPPHPDRLKSKVGGCWARARPRAVCVWGQPATTHLYTSQPNSN
jgi:hypothetical protein